MQQQSRIRLAEKRRRALSEAIEAAKSSKSELELIIKAEEARKAEVAEQLRRIGAVRHFYSYIPYINLRCDAEYADILRKASSGNVSDSVFEKGFRSIISAIKAVDVSNRLVIPKPFRSRSAGPEIQTQLWNLEAIGAYAALQYGSGDSAAVAVVDSGVDYSHSQLKARFGQSKGYDFVGNSDDPTDKNGHGTHVAGVVASEAYGIAPQCRLYAVRVLDENGSGSEADAIAGIEWCIKNSVEVVNMSFGSSVASQALEDVCNYAWQQGLLLVAAAGNNGYGPNYPAAFGESVIAVAAVDENLGHPGFSSIWHTNDISAPGVNIASTFPNEDYAWLSGTSMAAPHVTGSLALALSTAQGAGKNNRELEDIMKATADPYDEPDVFGAGLVRVDRIAQYLAGEAGKADYVRAAQNPLAPLLKNYFKLENAVDAALTRFAKDAAAEVRRLLS